MDLKLLVVAGLLLLPPGASRAQNNYSIGVDQRGAYSGRYGMMKQYQPSDLFGVPNYQQQQQLSAQQLQRHNGATMRQSYGRGYYRMNMTGQVAQSYALTNEEPPLPDMAAMNDTMLRTYFGGISQWMPFILVVLASVVTIGVVAMILNKFSGMRV